MVTTVFHTCSAAARGQYETGQYMSRQYKVGPRVSPKVLGVSVTGRQAGRPAGRQAGREKGSQMATAGPVNSYLRMGGRVGYMQCERAPLVDR